MSVLSDLSLRAMFPDLTPGPSSIDLHVGDTLLGWPDYVRRDPRYDQSKLWKPVQHDAIPGPDGKERVWVLKPGLRYLASTVERIALRPDCAGLVSTRSSWARDGLASICGSAGWIDAGFEGTVVLEISVIGSELVLWPGAAIAQLIVLRMTTPAERPYTGRYQQQEGVAPSRLHLDWRAVRR